MQTVLYTIPERARTNRALIEAFERAGLRFIPKMGVDRASACATPSPTAKARVPVLLLRPERAVNHLSRDLRQQERG